MPNEPSGTAGRRSPSGKSSDGYGETQRPSGITESFRGRFSGISDNFGEQVEKVTSFIRSRPMMTFATALGAGFLIGSLVLRNRNPLDFSESEMESY